MSTPYEDDYHWKNYYQERSEDLIEDLEGLLLLIVQTTPKTDTRYFLAISLANKWRISLMK